MTPALWFGAYCGVAILFSYGFAFGYGIISRDDYSTKLGDWLQGKRNYQPEKCTADNMSDYWIMLAVGSVAWPLTTIVLTIIGFIWSLIAVANLGLRRVEKTLIYKHRALVITSPNEAVREFGKKHLKKSSNEES